MSFSNRDIKIAKNVTNYAFGCGSLALLPKILKESRGDNSPSSKAVIFIDDYFKEKDLGSSIGHLSTDIKIFINANNEPTTDAVDNFVGSIKSMCNELPCAIVGIGGGTTMDISKAVSNLLTNHGKAKDYQGWDLVKNPGVYKIGIPTISGTGAEATRTCVMLNTSSNLKLGMNSNYSMFDKIILDPEITRSVPRNQFFYTGMDSYIHCMEALSGRYRNAIGDALSRESISLCQQVFSSFDMMEDINREKLMVASYLGGSAIATTYVGLVHPLSAALSAVLGIHHCLANCIVMRAMENFYPKYFNEFWDMAEKQKVSIPKDICKDLSDTEFKSLYDSALMHEKPLNNAFGENFKKALPIEKVVEIFKLM